MDDAKTRTAVRRLQSGKSSLQSTNGNVCSTMRARASGREAQAMDDSPRRRTISSVFSRRWGSEDTISAWQELNKS